MGRRFCPGGVIVSTLRAICAELGIGAAMLAGTVPAAAQPPEGKTAQKSPGLTGKMFVEAA